MIDNHGPVVATRKDLADLAQKHYEFVSMQACDWFSLMPKIIEFWRNAPDYEKRIAQLETDLAAANRLITVLRGECGV